MKTSARRRVAFKDKNVIHILRPGPKREYREESPQEQLRILVHEQCRLAVQHRVALAESKRLIERLTRLVGDIEHQKHRARFQGKPHRKS